MSLQAAPRRRPAPVPAPLPDPGAGAGTLVYTLPNGVRSVILPLPHLPGSVAVGVFVRTGSGHESARDNGISHVVEHMAFKGTATRDARQINLDAERLGAEVNAYTDKDHTAYHLHGRAADAATFVRLLADIVLNPSFPEAELERERQVILQELLEDEDDPVSNAFKLFDAACYGAHPLGRPVIGQRRNIERLRRDDLLAYVQRQYSGHNLVVGIAGDVDPQAMAKAVEDAFGAMPAGTPNALAPATFIGGARSRRMAGSSQSHVVLGFPIARSIDDGQAAATLAAALFGEGMSSPLMHALRERRALAYYVACSADMTAASGQFVVEASTTPEHLDEFFAEIARLLQAQAEAIASEDHERARNQLAVRRLRTLERPFRQLEDAAQDLFTRGRVRSFDEQAAAIEAVGPQDVQRVFADLLAQPAAVALVGKPGRWTAPRLVDWAAQGLRTQA